MDNFNPGCRLIFSAFAFGVISLGGVWGVHPMVCGCNRGYYFSLKANIMTRFNISNRLNLNLSALDFQPLLEQFGLQV